MDSSLIVLNETNQPYFEDQIGYLNIVPEEIIKDILNLLPGDDQLRAELVCRKWSRLLKGNEYDTISAVQYKYLPARSFSEEICIPFCQISFNEHGQVEPTSDFKNVECSIIVIQLSKNLAKKIFQIYKGQLKIDELKKSVSADLNDYWQDPSLITNCRTIFKNYMKRLNDTIYGTKESVEVFVSETSAVGIGGEKIKGIFIPSLKMVITPKDCFSLELLRREFGNKVGSQYDSNTTPLKLVKLPLSLVKKIKEIGKVELKIQVIKEEIAPELENIFKK